MALKPADITLVKTIKSPPACVKLTFAGMCVIVGIAAEKLTDPAAKKNVTMTLDRNVVIPERKE